MSYADNDGVRIHYHVEGEGPPLLLHHGLTSSLEDWREHGYVEGLKDDYRLILMDARGHGASDKPHDPEAYAMEHRVGDMVRVLNELGIPSAHFYGYSYGGRVGLEAAKLVPERVRSLIVGAAGPQGFGGPGSPNPSLRVLEQGLEAIVAVLEQAGPVSPAVVERLRSNDVQALIALVKLSRPSIEADLPAMTTPVLVYVGESDALQPYPQTKEYVKLLPNSTFFSLPGLDHFQAFARSELVLPRVREFLAEANREEAASTAN